MFLNDNQKFLVNDFFDNRIEPCLKEIFAYAKSAESKHLCYYLIQQAMNSTITKPYYLKQVEFYFGSTTKQEWLRMRLVHLHSLFQPDNDHHIFIQSIIDHRFYSEKSASSIDKWKTESKSLILEEYSTRIRLLLEKLFSEEIKSHTENKTIRLK